MSKRLRGLLAALVGLVLVAVLGLVLVIVIGSQGGVPVAQGPHPTGTTPQPTSVAYPPQPTPVPTQPPTPPPSPTVLPAPVLKAVPVPKEILAGEKIAFLRDQDMWLVDVASRALAQVTVSGNVTHIHGWSHDGNLLLLGVGTRPTLPEANTPKGTDLWVVNVKDAGQLQLTRDLKVRSAVWSPVSEHIAYDTCDDDLHVVKSDEIERRQLLAQGVYDNLAWSPDGSALLFAQFEATDWGVLNVALVGMDGDAIRQLTSNARENYIPFWSLDGKSILFASTRPRASGTGIWYRMNADGSNSQHLETSPRFSPTDVARAPTTDRIVYEQDSHIWIMDFNGNASKVAEGFDPSWSPDGSRLAYVGKDGGIWVIDINSKDAKQLTTSGSQPHWSN